MRALAMLVAVVVAGCVPQIGDACSDNGYAICTDNRTAMWCDRGFWFPYDCPGPNGCFKPTPNAANVACDFRGTPSGNPCPLIAVNSGFCRDAHSLLRCTADTDGAHFTPTNCSTCTQTEDRSLCQP